jgi:hypothetical protein
MSFQVMALIMTCAGCLLGARFIFAGGSVLQEWSIEATAGSLVAFRRIGVIYLGLALMFFVGRVAVPSDLRSAACLVTGAGRSRCLRVSDSSSSRLDGSALWSSARSSGRWFSRRALSGCGGAGNDRTDICPA